jgi:hypothetical protein
MARRTEWSRPRSPSLATARSSSTWPTSSRRSRPSTRHGVRRGHWAPGLRRACRPLSAPGARPPRHEGRGERSRGALGTDACASKGTADLAMLSAHHDILRPATPGRLLHGGLVERDLQGFLAPNLDDIPNAQPVSLGEHPERPQGRVAVATFESGQQAEGEHFARRLLLAQARHPSRLPQVGAHPPDECGEVHAGSSRHAFPVRQSSIRLLT